MDNQNSDDVRLAHWHRQQQWLVDFNLLATEQMLVVGSGLMKAVGLLSGAALLALVGAVEKGLICKATAFYASLFYLLSLLLILITQALSSYNMRLASNLLALKIIQPADNPDNGFNEDSVAMPEFSELNAKIKKSYTLGWTLGIISAVIFFFTTIYVLYGFYLI